MQQRGWMHFSNSVSTQEPLTSIGKNIRTVLIVH